MPEEVGHGLHEKGLSEGEAGQKQPRYHGCENGRCEGFGKAPRERVLARIMSSVTSGEQQIKRANGTYDADSTQIAAACPARDQTCFGQ